MPGKRPLHPWLPDAMHGCCDLVEATVNREGLVVLRPKVLVDRGLEEALAEAEADVKAGRVSKP